MSTMKAPASPGQGESRAWEDLRREVRLQNSCKLSLIWYSHRQRMGGVDSLIFHGPSSTAVYGVGNA